MFGGLLRLHRNLQARALRYWRAREVTKVLSILHQRELSETPVAMWAVKKAAHALEIAAVKQGKFDIIDRRSWAYPYIPEALHRLNQPILKNTPYNLRRFAETPIPRRAMNLVKNAVLSLKWRVVVDEDYDEEDPELLKNVDIATYCLKHPNLTDSWRTLMEAVVEDFLTGGYGTMEPQLTPDYRRPVKLWSVDGSCVSADTEVLTKRGWLFWPDVREDDEFATQNQKTRQFEWQKAFSLHRQKYKGRLLRFKAYSHDILVTPNHRMYGRAIDKYGRKATTVRGLLEFVRADEVAIGNKKGCYLFQLPTTSFWTGKLPENVRDGKLVLELNDGVRRVGTPGIKGFQTAQDVRRTYEVDLKDWLAFLGLYVAEGSCSGVQLSLRRREKAVPAYIPAMAASADLSYATDNRLYSVSISQAKTSRWYSEIKSLLSRLPWSFNEHDGAFVCVNKGLHGYLFASGNKYTKKVPAWIKELPTEYLQVFVDWAVKGDGHTRFGRDSYYTTSKLLADDMQEIFQKLGKTATVSERPAGVGSIKGKEYKKAPCYSVREGTKQWHGIGERSLIPYNDYVYCASVPNETLYMRRNGMPFWIGNTVRIYADWSEATPDRPHYAQLTGLKGERGIVSFLDDELVYIRDNVRSSTPFGLGRMEVAFLSINAFLGAQDMATRAGADQIHKTWLWFTTNLPAGQFETVQRHIQNEAEGQAKISIATGMPKPEVIPIQAVAPEDLLLEWQEFLIRIIASAFELSPLSLGLEKDVNRNTASTLAEQDFNSAVVPAARKIEEAVTRQILHRTLGWKELRFEFIGLEDPDEMVQVMLTRQLYASNAMTPDEIRDRLQLGGPLPGGYGKLTMGQMQLVTAAAIGKAGGGMGMSSGMGGFGGGMGMGSGSGMGMGMGSGMGMSAASDNGPQSLSDTPFSAEDVASMDPQTLQLYREAGLLPADPNTLQREMEAQQPGILQTLSEELMEYFAWLEEEQEREEVQPAEITQKDMKEQQKKFQQRQHDLSREERMARGIEQTNYMYQQGGYRGPFPKRKSLGPVKKKSTPNYTGRSR